MSWGTTTERTSDRAWQLSGAAVVWSDPAMEGGRIRRLRRGGGGWLRAIILRPYHGTTKPSARLWAKDGPGVPDSGADTDGGVPIVVSRARQGFAGPSRARPDGKPPAPRHHSNRLRSRIRIGGIPATWLATPR